MKLRVGTRGSRLALVQTESVAKALAAVGAEVELVRITTSGDRLAQVALAEFGGKALFVKEIEEALLDGRIDVAVHSLKDMPAVLPAGLTLGAFPTRADPGDVLVTRAGGDLADLAAGSVVGTSSLRRRVLLLGRRPDLEVRPIRGNVDTRLAKLGAGAFDALVLAQAGLERLGLTVEHAVPLPVADFVPAVGQGLLAVEVRRDDQRALEVVGRLDDTRSRMEALAERAFLHGLAADCHTPVAGHARIGGDRLRLDGLVASLDGRAVIRSSVEGAASDAEALGRGLAAEMLERGAGALLAAGGEAAR